MRRASHSAWCSHFAHAIAIALTGATAGALPPIRLTAQAKIVDSLAATGSNGQHSARDSNSVHKELRKDIQRFEDAWRNVWQSNWRPLTKKEDNLGPSTVLNPSARRGIAMSCYQRTPGKIGPISPGSPQHPVAPQPDHGALCPIWYFPWLPLPADEGEAIDLALPVGARDSVRAKREVLIRVLEQAQKQHPDDAWIVGQRVRFVYDQRDAARTVAAAHTCRGDAGECAGLLGLALQQEGKMVAAESVFRVVDSLRLTSSTDKTPKCIDPDVVTLLNVADRERVDKSSCEQQKQFAGNLWWLADPLWSVPGNERYVAHGSRRIHRELRDINSRDERYVWDRSAGGDALRETILRYGWPSYTNWLGPLKEQDFAGSLQYFPRVSYRRRPTVGIRVVPAFVPPPLRIVAFPFTTKEYSIDRTALIPAFKAIVDPFSLTTQHYQLTNPDTAYLDVWWPNEHMMLHYKIATLDSGQTALWRRDSSLVYQLTIDDPLRALDTTATGASLATLTGGSSATDTRELARTPIAKDYTLRLNTALSGKPIVLSAEILPRTLNEQAMRLRFGLRPPSTLRDMKANDVALSDPVFMRLPNREMPVPVDEASVLRYMAGGLTFARSEILALYWESYGFTPGDTVQIELRIRRDDDRSAARRVGAALGIVSALRDSISIKWTEPDGRHTATTVSGSKPVVARTVALDVNALAPGNYVAIIEMRKGAQAPARSERRFVITDQ